VLGDQVYLPIADEQRQIQAVYCFDRETGADRWQAIVHQGGFDNKGNPNAKSSLASSTIAADGDRLYINFLNQSAVWTTALDMTGKVLWQQKISDYVIHQGYGSSPTVYQQLVIVAADNKSGGAIVGLDRQSGEIVWRHERPQKPNYPSPVVLHIDGRDQMIMTGCDLVTSLDPLSGRVLWEIEGATTECVTTTVTDGTHVFSTGGYPRNHIAAVVADGSGRVAWETNTRAYVPSLLAKDGYLYATLDAGVAICVRANDGQQVWKGRLGGTFSSSPVLVGELIYSINEAGETFVFKADPAGFELIARNKLGDDVFATPAICGGRIYVRIAAQQENVRQEYLVCIGSKSP
jgi:outer membrane protein assembly factor BamB